MWRIFPVVVSMLRWSKHSRRVFRKRTGAAELHYKITLDWTEWKLFEIALKSFALTRSPIGWTKVDLSKLASTGWSQTPYSTPLLYFDALQLTNTQEGQ